MVGCGSPWLHAVASGTGLLFVDGATDNGSKPIALKNSAI